MCPESLRVYALKGVSEHASWVNKAMRADVDAVRGTSYPVISAGEGMLNMQTELVTQWTAREQAQVEAEPLRNAALINPARARRPRGKPSLPARDPNLAQLLHNSGVVLPPSARKLKVAERQRLLLLARPGLADTHEVPADVLAAAGLAPGPDPEAPPPEIADAD